MRSSNYFVMELNMLRNKKDKDYLHWHSDYCISHLHYSRDVVNPIPQPTTTPPNSCFSGVADCRETDYEQPVK